MEIVFSFDTTGSMSRCLDEVRGRLADLVQRLQADIPNIKIAIFAHGDYCDQSIYVTKYVDFTDDVTKLTEFVQNVSETGGGDSDECYELVLHEVRTKLSWTFGSQRSLVLIGDSNPHEPNYLQNTLKLDWRKEADGLAVMGVRIYSVQCGSNDADEFYADIANRTCGKHLKLSDFTNIFDFLMTVCYREKSNDLFHNYEKEVRVRRGIFNKDLDGLFGDLRSVKSTSTTFDSAQDALRSSAIVTTRKTKLTKSRLVLKKSKKSLKRQRSAKLMAKYALKNLQKLRRENVPECNFIMRDMSWSKWHLVLSATEKPSLGLTFKRFNGGYRTKSIFNEMTDVPALYEIAIQPKYRTKRYVIYNKLSFRGFNCGTNWERRLLGKPDINAEINGVIQHNCSVFVRRVTLKGAKTRDNIVQSLKRYDYAWKIAKSERTGHRQVIKANVTLSHEMKI